MKNISIATMCASLLLLGACASKQIAFESAPATMAAQTRLKVKASSNGNSEIQLKVKHMTPPDKVKQGATTYVVWAQPSTPSDAPMMNLGTMKPNKDLNGEFKSVTPYRNFKILLTPESDQSVAMPTADPVLWTKDIDNKG